MFQEWYKLTNDKGQENNARIRIGIQYIYDQGLFFENLIKSKEEERSEIEKELRVKEDILHLTSVPFEYIFNPEKFQEEKKETMIFWDSNGIVGKAMESFRSFIGPKVDVAEKFLEEKASGIIIKNINWQTISQICCLLYLGMSTLATFSREDFMNVTIYK